VIQDIEAGAPLWQSIVGSIKLATLAKSPTTAATTSSAKTATGGAAPTAAGASSATGPGKRTSTLFGIGRNRIARNPFLVPDGGDADSRPSSRRGSAHALDATAVAPIDSVIPAPVEPRKKIDKGRDKFNIFGLF